MYTIRVGVLAALAALLLGMTVPSAVEAPAPGGAVPVESTNMEHVAGVAAPGGMNMEFFERAADDGSVGRYAVAAVSTNGFVIIDFTDPANPTTVGRYLSPERTVGANYHPWVQVNEQRDIVAISIQEPGAAAVHGGSTGVEFVDISDLTSPTHLGAVDGLEGPHSITMIGDAHVYTTGPTYIIDYSDPANPENLGQPDAFCGRQITVDPNHPDRAYVGECRQGGWSILDTSDPAAPQVVTQFTDLPVAAPYEVMPSPDSSFVGVGDFQSGPTHVQCPGGGIHFYDISGEYVEGASVQEPKKIGAWFAPFGGAEYDTNSSNPNWGPCTPHNWDFAPERRIAAAGILSGGHWVFDPNVAPEDGDTFDEWDGEPGPGLGPTTWGNTTGRYLAEGDVSTASQWLPFDLDDPEAERLVVTHTLTRGVDVYRYTGPMPDKIARLTVDAEASAGDVTGTLDRYAVLTHDGWANKPLAGEEITVEADGASTTVTTGTDGSFSADLGLGAGTHTVTVTWSGDDTYQATTVEQQVSG